MQLWRNFLAVVAVALGVSSVKADVIIDDFAAPVPASNVNLAVAPGSTYNQTDSVVSGSRALFVQQLANVNNANPATNILLGNTGPANLFAMSTTVGATSYSTLTYTFTGPLDLVASAATDIRFTVRSSDQATAPYYLTVTGTGGSVTTFGTITGTFSPVDYTTALSSFSGAGLTGVTSVSFGINTGTAASTPELDISITDLRFLAPPPPNNSVPAPPAVFLMLAALPALGFRRVREKLGLAKTQA